MNDPRVAPVAEAILATVGGYFIRCTPEEAAKAALAVVDAMTGETL